MPFLCIQRCLKIKKKCKAVLHRNNLNSVDTFDRIVVQFSMDQKGKRENGNITGAGYKNITGDI